METSTQLDEKITEVIRFVISEGEVRASKLQRKFLWGYNRAEKAIKQLEDLKICEPFAGLISRKLIVNKEQSEIIIQSL